LFTPFVVSILTSSTLVLTCYTTSWILFRSPIFSFTFAWLWVFGTQLVYAYTLGNILGIYIVLSYFLVNLVPAYRLMFESQASAALRLLHLVTLVVVALSSEVWLNYGAFLVAASTYLMLWHRHHATPSAARGSQFVLLSTLSIMALYLMIRAQTAYQYLTPGVEEEMIFTYSRATFMVDDFIGNFFTFLYTALTNFLPPFLVGSNSIVYYGRAALEREQHGYHNEYVWLVAANHLFFWRYYAGFVITLFGYFGLKWVRRSWQESSRAYATLVVFVAMTLIGFSTHLFIKFRPYNSVPALPYKAIVSILGVSLLIGYLVALAKEYLTPPRYRLVVGAVLAVSLLGAFTRPRMLSALLAEVGLRGYSDPLGDSLRGLRLLLRAAKHLL
jgi:hypothetical protein